MRRKHDYTRPMAIAVLIACLLVSINAYALQEAARKQYVCPPCGCGQDDKVYEQPGSCPACNMALIDKAAQSRDLSTITSFLKLNDKVWTGGQPTLDQMSKLKEEGIKVIINLRPHGEYKEGESEAAKARELGLRYINVPVVYLAPKDEDATEFLRVTDENLSGGQVFIHCAAAIRVGAFWMIRRVLRDGWTFEKALEEANRIGLRDRPHLVQFAKSYIERHQKK
jgi:uncharacterized protein (TIGR01244 family)